MGRPFDRAVPGSLSLVLAGMLFLSASLVLPEDVIHDHVYHFVIRKERSSV